MKDGLTAQDRQGVEDRRTDRTPADGDAQRLGDLAELAVHVLVGERLDRRLEALDRPPLQRHQSRQNSLEESIAVRLAVLQRLADRLRALVDDLVILDHEESAGVVGILQRLGTRVVGGCKDGKLVVAQLLQVVAVEFEGRTVQPMQGQSVLDFFSGEAKSPYAGAAQVGYELFGLKAYFDGDWKILQMPPPFASGEWELYNLAQDPAESNDLSKEYPGKVENMIERWEQYKENNSVLDVALDLSRGI